MANIFNMKFWFVAATLWCGIHAFAHAQADKSAKVLYVGDNHLASAKIEILKQSAQKNGLALDAYSTRSFSKHPGLEVVCQYDVVLTQAVSQEAAQGAFEPIAAQLQTCGNKPKAMAFGYASSHANQDVSENTFQRINPYFENGFRNNFESAFALMSNLWFGGQHDVKEAVLLPNVGVYHPGYADQMTANASSFFTWLEQGFGGVEKARVGILMHRSAVENEQTQLVDATIKSIEKQGGQAFGIFFDGNDAHQGFRSLTKGRVQALINYRMLHEAEKNKSDFEEIGVPVIHGLVYREGDRASFDAADAGISAMMSPYFLMMPESAGVIDPTIVATVDKARTQIPMLDHIDAIADRALKQANLSLKPSSQKKLALFMWNYPPGDKNMGASFLNVPDSIHDIASELKQAGYLVDVKSSEQLIDEVGKILRPFYTQSGLDLLMEKGLSDHLPVAQYRAWLASLPNEVREPILARWGAPEDHIYVRKVNGQAAFIIPQIKMGNLIAMPQPGRSDEADSSASLYHDTESPINHYYLAVYFYAREKFGADAFIHLGTHGSQEWLPGKERGLSIYDAPQLTVGNTPIVYPFVMDNVGEAMQAKRRGRAVMLSHMTPGFAEAGYYGDFAELEDLLEQYMTLAEGKTKAVVEENILSLSQSLTIFEDVGFTATQAKQSFPDYMLAVHDYMHELGAESQPLGVHTFGQTLNDPHLMTTVAQMLGNDFKELVEVYEREHKITLKQAPNVFSKTLEDNQVVQLDATPGFKLLWAILVEDQSLSMSDELNEQVLKAKDFAARIRGQQEMQNMLKGLSGEFVPVGYGGDPVRAHDAVPTGVNLLGFNPAKVPSKAAWEVGQKLVDDVISKHYAEKGQYPDKLAFSLWSLETMRHHGVLESQVLAAMGVRPVWDENGFLKGTEVIPYSELKRPRVDVVASATGLYRDAFPNVMIMLAKAVEQVAKLKEDNNSVYQHAETLKQTLMAEGMDEKEASYLSTIRVFSNDSGSYGSGLADTALASDTWETDSKLADLYLKRLGYAFGSDAKRWSDKVNGLYAKALSGTDAVLFSRSSNLYGMNTSDDPFQYFGGLALAIRNIDGASPEMLISNLREQSEERTESFNRFMARELRNRSFHPRWIEEAQKEGYSGASMMLDRINNFWGWTVMYPEGVTDQQWQTFADVYVKDKYNMDMREFFEQSNPTNLAQMIERMLEAERKDYWDTDEETLKTLVQTYLELKRDHSVVTDNQAFLEELKTNAQGFGLQPLLNEANATLAQELAEQQQATENREVVEGQKLEEVTDKTTETSWDWYLTWSIMLILAMVLVGAYREWRVSQKPMTMSSFS